MNSPTAAKTSWNRRLIGASAAGAVAAAVALAGVPGAFAADEGYLEMSRDGVTYSSSLPGPIFNQSLVYVPGASTSATVWIRNTSDEQARLSSAALMVRSDPQLDSYIGLAAGLESGGASRAALGQQGTCTDLGQVWELEAGEEIELALVADLSKDAPNDTMNRSADFDVLFFLESKDAVGRTACSAAAASGNPVSSESGGSSAELVILSGDGVPPTAASGGTVLTAIPANPREGDAPQAVARLEQRPQSEQQTPYEITPAGFQSTVEPIIRSLSGTLLIAMSVAFTAAVILRIRNRSA